MKFRMFTLSGTGNPVAINGDMVEAVFEGGECVTIYGRGGNPIAVVSEDLHTVVSRLNTIAE